MNQKKKISRKVISYVLALMMVLSTFTGIVPGMSLTALAYNGNPYASLVESTTTVKFNNIDWYIIADDSTAVDDGTVTLLAKDPIGGASKFHDSSNKYSSSTVKTYLDSLTATGGSFEAVADAITPVTLNIYKYNSTTEVAETIQNAKLWLLSTSEANELTKDVRKCSQASGAENKNWWLRSPGSAAGKAACMFGWNGYLDGNGYSVTNEYGVRPALKLDLSKVTFVSVNLSGGANATVSGGSTTQAYFNSGSNPSEMTSVTYTASDGYKFPKTSAAYGNTNDITVTRTSDTVITVSGTPTAVTEITIPDAEDGSRIEQTVTAPKGATDLTYQKEQAQALLTGGASVSEGNGNTEAKIQYSLTPTDDNSWVDNYTDVKATNAGEYKVYYRVAGNDTYADFVSSDEQAVSVKIEQADPVTLLENAYSAKYGQYAKDVTLPEGWKWADPEKKFESTGEVGLTANFAESDNYIAKTKLISVLVVPAAAKISYEFTEVPKEYGSTSFTNEITNTGDVTPTYTSSKISVATVDNTGLVTIKGIGETTITANVAEDNDHYTYETRTASYKLIVNPISTEISTAPTATDITYGQKLSESTLSGGVATVAGKFAWKQPDTVPNASENGEYEVVFTPTDTNYAESTCNVKVKVKKAAAPATKESLLPEQKPATKNADDLVYTGEPIELVTAPANPLEGYKVQYSKDNGTTWTDTIPTETNVGTYTVKVKYVSDNYENIDLDDITVEITPVSKEQLEKAVAAASKYFDTIKDNDDYSSVFTDLQNAINAANTTLQIENPTADQIGQAVKAINDAKTAAEKAVKAIDDEKAAKAVLEKIKALTPATEITPADRTDIRAARKAYDDLTDDQKAKFAELDPNAVATLEAAEQALDTVEKAAFDDEKEVQKKAADALAAEGDSDASKKLIEDAKKAIDVLAYDKSKSVDENKAALAAIVSKLKSDLTDNRAAEKKEADDTAAAKKVTDAINDLPASDKVATTDKAAIEAARKAYDALTADQKKKVPADVLKKLTDTETALKEAEKDAADKTTADKVIEAINKLPSSDKVATTDKAAIEAARKAYDALTADQKKKVSADVLKKLTDAEKALKAAEAADKATKELEAAKKEAQAAMNEQVTVTQKGKKFTVKWKKSTSADGYYVYASYCGKKATKPVKTVKKNTTTKVTISKINGKKISTKKNFHVYVVPYKIIDGKKVALGKSTVAHLVGAKSTKYSNVKKLTLTKKKYTVKVGKTAKIKAKVTLVNKNKKHIPKGHGAKFRYKSSDTSIATVDKNGKIKGIKKGTCTIYVYSINGLMKKAKVTIK